jgi:hypothetical protein
MSRQALGKSVAVPTGTAAPSGTNGLLLADINTSRRAQKYRLKIKATAAGAFTFRIALWGLDIATADGGDWGRFQSVTGELDNGNTFSSATSDCWYVPLEEVGFYNRFYVQVLGSTGSPTVTAALAEVLQQGE